MLNNNIILKSEDVALFCMPSLEEKSTKKIEEIERQAYEEGFAAGEKAGFSEGEQKAVILIDSLHELLEKIAGFKDELVDNLESQAVDLSICIARKVINEEVQTRPDVIVSMVKEALRRLQRSGTISVKINPVLHELFMEKKSELMEIHRDITFDVNANIAVAGPLVVSEIEEVVTDVESLLDNVIDKVLSGRPNKETGNNGDEIIVAEDVEVEVQVLEQKTTDDLTIDKAIDDEEEENSEQN